MNGYTEIMGRATDISGAAVRALSGRESGATRVWLVDDNANFRKLLAELLDDEGGFDCERQFYDPPSLLEALAQETPPDIILLDIEMGPYNGLEAIRPIKALAKDTHVLMLTTFAEPGSRERAYREGASDFMLKSWSPAEIAAHVRQAVELGNVAGLLTTFLSPGRPVLEKMAIARTESAAPRATIAERWVAYLRGLMKFSPS